MRLSHASLVTVPGSGHDVHLDKPEALVRAFREPFMTGDAEHTRAAALALVISTLGFAILKFTDLKDKGEWVLPAAGAGALLGGLIFGIGMVLAGGCGSGSIWRVGEGQVKEDVRARGMKQIGRYAVQIEWSDGHSTGIYSWDYLLKLREQT